MRCRPSLRARLWLGAMALAALAVLAAGLGIYGLARTESLATEAMAAQRRIEAYGALSLRVNEWLLGWAAPGGQGAPEGGAVRAALDDLDRLIAADVAAAASETEAAQRARQSLSPARLRAQFATLEAALAKDPPGTPAGAAAVSFYGAQAPAILSGQIGQEVVRRDAALAALDRLRPRLYVAAGVVAVLSPLLLLALYLLLLRPLFARLDSVTVSAEALAMGGLPPGAGGHDELGLMFARLRQMAARIDRRRAGLEHVVMERTAALSAANDRLARIDSTRRRFFADVGHELRTPLTVILGEAELGARHADPQVRASFQTVQARAQRLFRRIEDLLRIARSESGQLELAAARVDLRDTVEAALADLAPLLRRAGVTVRADLPPLSLCGDGDWLRQVFAGMFDNAAKYAGRGAEVRVSCHAEGAMAVIEVSDSGPGLPPGQATRVFDRFARAGETAPGFGVGLALARWVAEASGGGLTLAEGPGFCLRLVLPLWQPALEEV